MRATDSGKGPSATSQSRERAAESSSGTIESLGRRIGRHQLSSLATLTEKVKRLGSHDPHYTLLLGAGASLSSGIPTGERLVARWKREVLTDLLARKPTDDELTSWLAEPPPERLSPSEQDVRSSFSAWRRLQEEERGRHHSEYSLLFTHFHKSQSDRQQFIETLVEGFEPGPGYIYLTSLVLAGKFKIIVTTNFDDNAHDALFRYGGEKPIVCSFDAQVKSIRLGSPRPKILKLHGDFLFDNLRNTTHETERLGVNMEDKLRAACVDRGLIVLGYAGADASVMGPLRELLEQRDGSLRFGLHWFIHDTSDAGPVCIPEALYHMLRAFPERVHVYTTSGFDHVMERFYAECECEPPPLLGRPIERSLFHSLNTSLVRSHQRYHVSPLFNELLKQFMDAQFEPQVPAMRLCEIADLQFQDARSKKVRVLQNVPSSRLKEGTATPGLLAKSFDDPGLTDDLDSSIASASEAFESAGIAPPRLDLAARARRRSSGALGEKAEILWHRGDLNSVVSATRIGIVHAREGIEVASRIRDEVQLRPLYYNGLSGMAMLCASHKESERGGVFGAHADEASAWYRNLRRRDVDGDDLGELRRDTPGWSWFEQQLLSHLDRPPKTSA